MSEQPKTQIRRRLDEADKALLDEAEAAEEESAPGSHASTVERMRKRAEEKAPGSLPDIKEDWQAAAVPSDLIIPRGEEVTIMKFEASACKGTARHKGDRTAVLFQLTVTDERIARQRMFGDATRGLEEMAKMMIRAIDGHTVRVEDPSEVERFWDEIGPRYRNMLVAWYQKTHNFDTEERLLFLGACVAVRTAH